MAENGKTIGSLNGPWALGLKVMIAGFPVFLTVGLTWGVWVTNSIFQLHPEQPRYTAADAARDHLTLLKEIDGRIDKLPPKDWRDRIQKMEVNLQRIHDNQITIMAELRRQP